ncbi:MAG: 1-(5-phosphoribosyl)-5-[(5-phosphoribosylamino)methylideneamino]imidazole-4-carboxamide isomerase [Firmicutes bacterium]|jgi:phosphoribosylformimino-5-aminoimidazole carboxamide ribotide isomerase|nr:1-(5-phosphoribosyl)-5-[(5-phosphoribosylamino)methylideneamino]imidazole-4-carboxamide isomerase [Dethiobacter sp.]MBS3897220.1 1-(5-phosphoribosyl)-5-[(5-phosphoribosylamino)methylideneamino]imidazole-4-carboxamide isomerase [Dethiobacter sp.]MCL4462538.1 1-(5-phosphoribosyl)-5-[(5-phosphoribosylamino)methylideneamino]imidazole-4-carboxamide isomerase [Bacillota bacterium]MCL5993166.1 1-(5-phosphoribosyl)-5-[(5-phosphoribosylamino)methylideneamino]imidazole-4-carboxamide isomerase [Bacillot
MLIIPAVDIRDGRCVRLVHGELAKETVYHADPVAVALRWEAEGAARIHLVDLDGAFQGGMQNSAVIEQIARAVKVPVQVGGGIRDEARAAELLDRGVSRVILGTVAVTSPRLVEELCYRFPGQVLVGIDARAGRVAIRGWVEEAEQSAIDLACKMGDLGIKEIIYTDINRDGTLQGPNLVALEEMAKAVSLQVIASGGVSSLDDLQKLCLLEPLGVSGVILGQALYTGRVDLRDALKIAGCA